MPSSKKGPADRRLDCRSTTPAERVEGLLTDAWTAGVQLRQNGWCNFGRSGGTTPSDRVVQLRQNGWYRSSRTGGTDPAERVVQIRQDEWYNSGRMGGI